MDARIVIVAYRPKSGKAEALQQLMRDHYSVLEKLGLVTNRAPVLMEAKDGTIVEVFEWRSTTAIEQAHTHPEVLEMWAKYADACDYIPLGQLEEATKLFADFTPFI